MNDFTNSIETLKLGWETLLQPFLVEPKLRQNVFFNLVAAYSSAGRFYHNLEHIHQVLETIEQIYRCSLSQASPSLNFPVIQLAAWFHDVIYDPKAKDNEEKSTEYAEATLKSLKIQKTTIAQVKNLILTTKNHQAPPTDLESQILLDADLAILGSTESEYRAYSQAIRQEYSWVCDAEYRLGRKQVLQKFLQRERIYLTSYLFVTLEEKARQNLQSEIAALPSSSIAHC